MHYIHNYCAIQHAVLKISMIFLLWRERLAALSSCQLVSMLRQLTNHWHNSAPVSAYLLLVLGLFCLPFPANCFSRHNPIHTIPSPTWRVKATLYTGSYNGDILLCWLPPLAVSAGEEEWSHTGMIVRRWSRLPLNYCRWLRKKKKISPIVRCSLRSRIDR